MPAAAKFTREQRKLRAQLAAHESWASTTDRSARARKGHRASPASVDYWLDKVDPDGVMSDDERRKAAESKQRAHMARLALASSRARSARKFAAEQPARSKRKADKARRALAELNKRADVDELLEGGA